MARRSLVLLEQRRHAAAASGRPGRTVAPSRIAPCRLGPNADDVQAQLGDWAGASGQVDWMPDGQPRGMIETVLDGFRAVVPPNWTIVRPRAPTSPPVGRTRTAPCFPDGQPAPDVVHPEPVGPGADRRGGRRRRGRRLRRRRRRRHHRADRRGAVDRHAGTQSAARSRCSTRSARDRQAARGRVDQLQAAGPAAVGASAPPRSSRRSTRACGAAGPLANCCSA